MEYFFYKLFLRSCFHFNNRFGDLSPICKQFSIVLDGTVFQQRRILYPIWSNHELWTGQGLLSHRVASLLSRSVGSCICTYFNHRWFLLNWWIYGTRYYWATEFSVGLNNYGRRDIGSQRTLLSWPILPENTMRYWATNVGLVNMCLYWT